MANAVLIGLAGFALTAANPVLWLSSWLDSQELTVPVFILPIFLLSLFFYGLLIPSAVMWLLSVRRAHSHEMYDLLRGPLAAFLLLLVLLIIMLITKFDISATIKTPLVIINQYSSRQTWTRTSLALTFAQGLVFSFLGVSIIELISRVRKRFRR
jgi:hypothetical protein